MSGNQVQYLPSHVSGVLCGRGASSLSEVDCTLSYGDPGTFSLLFNDQALAGQKEAGASNWECSPTERHQGLSPLFPQALAAPYTLSSQSLCHADGLSGHPAPCRGHLFLKSKHPFQRTTESSTPGNGLRSSISLMVARLWMGREF